jgi:hypothetical protein
MSADLTPEDLERIEEAAIKAAELDINECAEWYTADELQLSVQYEKNARLIASCDPQTILALVRMARRVVEAERDAEANKEFAELWYFVMDEAAYEFEKIVTTHSSTGWLSAAVKLRRERKA